MRYYLIIILFVLVSCGQSANKKKHAKNSIQEHGKNTELTLPQIEKNVDNLTSGKYDTIPKKGISIIFQEFKLLIDNIEVWDENGNLKRIQGDTVKVSLDIGEMLRGNTIRIVNSSYDKIEIYQRYENSVTIMNEGPHCDMLNWKHYLSDWETIKSTDNLEFEANSLTSEQMERFTPVDLNDFKEAVNEHCGKKWADLIKEIKSVNDYPCGIGTSKIELKIVLTNSKTSNSVEKIIEFEIPMGC